MKIDMHVHTNYSVDGKVDPVDVVKQVRKIGLSGVAITDHNEIEGALAARDYGRRKGVLVLIGEEISTTCGHLLAFNINKVIEKGLSPEESIERIKVQGGFAVAAHPDRYPNGLPGSIVRQLDIVAIETVNSYSVLHKNRRARKLAYGLELGMTGGSDAHRLKDIGRAYTVFKGTSLTPLDIEQQLLAGGTEAVGRSLPYHYVMAFAASVFIKWASRGFRNI